jgi:hypothetical protein
VQITAEFMAEFERLLRTANHFIYLASSTKWRTESSMLPLYQRLKRAEGGDDVAWTPTARDWVRTFRWLPKPSTGRPSSTSKIDARRGGQDLQHATTEIWTRALIRGAL